MEKIWDITVEFLAKINAWIPLVAILWAGIGLVGVVLILAITGAFLRKRLVPQWLIWLYFTFSAIVIFAQANNDIFTVVANMEIPCLVVLLCYVLRLLFTRRPRYTYVEKTVLSREISGKKQSAPVVKDVAVLEKQVKDEKELELDEKVIVTENTTETGKVEKSSDNVVEVVKDDETTEVATEKNETNLALNLDDEDEIATNFFGSDETKSENNSAFELPTVEPIPDKVYQPTREPAIVTTPISERIPELKTQTTNSTIRTVNNTNDVTRPTSFTSSLSSTTNRSTTVTRPVATGTTTANNSFTSMYNPRIVKTTTTSTTTTTTPKSSVTTTTTYNPSRSSVNTTSTAKTTTSSTSPRSTDDILAAIERLRSSMKK